MAILERLYNYLDQKLHDETREDLEAKLFKLDTDNYSLECKLEEVEEELEEYKEAHDIYKHRCNLHQIHVYEEEF